MCHIAMHMDQDLQQFQTPGQYIQFLLEEKGWSQKVLAVVLQVDEAIVNKIISGKKNLDAKMAIALSDTFSIPADVFLTLQKKYELALAQILTKEDPARFRRAQLFASLPIPEMIKRGWLNVSTYKDVEKVEKELLDFFQTDSFSEIQNLPHASKKTDSGKVATPTQIAWIYRVKAIASEMRVGRYSPVAVKASLPKLKELLVSPVATRKVSRILAECGIRFVIVETLKGAKIDGVCLWLDDASPVIGMSLRFDRIDNFWFVLRHELEHVIQEHGKTNPMLDVNLQIEEHDYENVINEEESIANAAAAEFCVPQKQLKSFIVRKRPFFYDRDIIGFSKTIGRHPGLIAGQLRFQLKTYNRFNSHLAKIRSIVTRESISDGWGNVVPLN